MTDINLNNPPLMPPRPQPSLSLWAYYKQCFSKNYVNFQGRARRKEYWAFQLFNLLALIVVVSVLLIGSGSTETAEFIYPTLAQTFSVAISLVILALYVLVAFLPSLAVSVRRLHDVGITGWLLLISLVPYLGGPIIFIITVIPGAKGANAYGPSPKVSTQLDVDSVFG